MSAFKFLPFALVASFACSALVAVHAAPPPVDALRLYTLDCGRVKFKDFGMFADTGEYDGQPVEIADPCFVIRHPKGILLWDTGLGDAVAAHADGLASEKSGIHLRVPVTLASQLQTLRIAPADVTYLAFSHMHYDHTGNANLFGASTWILDEAELAAATGEPTPHGDDPPTFSAYKRAKKALIDGDHDVFGDGSVRILKAPGHTPGHHVLALRLKNSGTVILSGDLYHSLDNRAFRRVPAFNVSRADTLASIDRIEAIAKNTHARVVIQHAVEDFEKLPKPPAYLD
ncbi:N-acyl homoserine lactonase family protein [Dokdonella sp.]|uniref:N-acyl homoserine lactonase family protein n=1 Tax=Dokdonella sp. TaxID=2291710 RepID=UPI002F418A74